MISVLIGSPIKQKEVILKEFLSSLKELNTEELKIEYMFIDDNESTSTLLQEFSILVPNVHVIAANSLEKYHCDEITHYWQENTIWKVAEYKNYIIEYAKENNFDYLFLVDSDLVLHPETLAHLICLKKDIISEVFWTSWAPGLDPLPQVWVGGQYRLHDQKRGEVLDDVEIAKRRKQFMDMLRCPGTYKVGGLGACTLISKYALDLDVSFSVIYNLDYVGEDRHFCVRAAGLGLELFADTHYPAFHIYRESNLKDLERYKRCWFPQKEGYRKITLAMLVKNEAKRYLKKVLEHAARYVDNAVILDDASTDDTVEVCKEVLSHIPYKIAVNEKPQFHNEIILRKQLWQLAVETNPDWILILDADEIFEDRIIFEARVLADNDEADAYFFRLYDMWDEEHFREDEYWKAHQYFRPFMVRYKPDFAYQWLERPHHCGRFPQNVVTQNGVQSTMRLKHLGWMKASDRVDKYFRYKQFDPHAQYGIKEQYLSILDPKPNLVKWE